MALHWSIEKVERWEELANDPAERVVTDALVLGSIPLGLDKITAANVDEWWRRITLYEAAFGSFIRMPNHEPISSANRTRLAEAVEQAARELEAIDAPKRAARIRGALVGHSESDDRPIRRSDIARRIGLSTNANRLTGPQFRKQMIERWWREIERVARNARNSEILIPAEAEASDVQ